MQVVNRAENGLLARMRAYAVRIIRLYAALPKSDAAQHIGKQLLRSGTSVGAHLAEAGHTKSKADFACKIEGALQELEESRYWMELLVAAGCVKPAKLQPLIDESGELIAILVTIARRTQRAARAK